MPLVRSYQLGKSTGATNIQMPVILVKTDGFIQTTYFCKYPFGERRYLISEMTAIRHPPIVTPIVEYRIMVIYFHLQKRNYDF
jgi:hypothetical protein